MKKVLHIVNGEHFAGAERVQDNLALGLPQYGYCCEFVTLKNGAFLHERTSVVPVHYMPMRSRLSLTLAKDIVRLARRTKACLIHTHTPRSIMLGAVVSILSGLPLVHHLHSPTSRDTGKYWRDYRNAVIENLALCKARLAIAVSQSLAEHASKQFLAPSKIKVIPNGIAIPCDISAWNPPKQDEPWIIGFAALIRPRKGLEVLLQAMALLRDRKLNVVAYVIGAFETVDYQEQITSIVRSLQLDSCVKFFGYQKDVSQHYRLMHIFTVPSLFGEGMPMVALEAMAHGLPIVATRVEGLSEALGNGTAGLLVAPNDPVALAEAIYTLIANQEATKKLSKAARQRSEGRYSIDAMSRGMAAVYDEVIF